MTQTPVSQRSKVRLRRSPVFIKRPKIIDIEYGEIAINYNASEPGLFIRDLDDEGISRIRKIGPVHFGDIAPNTNAGLYGFNPELSNGEMWVDSTDGEDKYILKVWNQAANGGTGAWIVVGEVYGRVDGYLDQFKDSEDGDDYIHTDRARLKINNKTALRGLSSLDGDKLLINGDDEFSNGVEVNASVFRTYSSSQTEIDAESLDILSNGVDIVSKTMSPFQTDSVSNNIFTFVAHGLFSGEKVLIYPQLSDGTTASPVAPGEYFVINVTNDTFQISEDGINPVSSSSNIFLACYEYIEIDANSNYFSTGNFAYKDLRLTPGDGQVEDGHWDVYHNPLNGNVRIYARAGNSLIEPEGPGLSIEVKNASLTSPIPKGTPVFFLGYDTIHKLAKVEIAKSLDPTTMPGVGVTKEDIAPGGRGYIVFLGRIENLNTVGLEGGTGSDEGKVLYVGTDGGLTLNPPSPTINAGRQAIAILVRQDETNGVIVVNNPSAFSSNLPALPEEYVWIGNSSDVAIAHRLDSNSFRIRTAESNIVELTLASNLKFGGYEFLYDENSSSKIQTKVSTQVISPSAPLNATTIASFDASLYRSAKFIVQVSLVDSLSTFHEICELLVIHNNLGAFLTEYGAVNTSTDLDRFGIFDARISQTGECELTFLKHPWINGNLTIKVIRTAILV